MRNALTPRQASAELGLSPQRLRQWAADGRLEHIRIGRKIWIPSSEVDRIMRAGRRERGSSQGEKGTCGGVNAEVSCHDGC